MSRFRSTKDTALEWGLVNYLGQPPQTAKAISFFAHVFVVLLLVFAVGVFLEWRLVAFEELGCPAYCNCTAQWYNREFYLGADGEWVVVEEDVDGLDTLIDRIEELEAENRECRAVIMRLKRGYAGK